MKKPSSRLLPLAAALAVFITTPAVKAQNFCSNATMSGTYVVSATGTVNTSGGPVAITVVGKVTYFGDGTGKVTASTTSTGGAVSRISAPVAGTYTVNSDCTGSKILGGTHYDFVISPNGRVINWIITESGVTVSGTGVRLDNQS